jgi:phenolic acid decarboxylase
VMLSHADFPPSYSGADEKWEYEMWFYNENRIVYAIHGGPMAGRINFQTADYQCIRPGELWQCNWLEGGLK